MAANRATGVVQQTLVDSGDVTNLRATGSYQQTLVDSGSVINLRATTVVQQVLRSVDDAQETTGNAALLIGL